MRRKAAGQRPKPDDERVRYNPKTPTYDRTPVEWDGVVRGPALPRGRKWTKMSKQLWEKFRRSPQSMVCIDTDWFFLLDTMVLYDRYWTDQDDIPSPHLTNLAAEIRRRFSYYGWTWDDRVKQRIDIISPQNEVAQEAAIQAEVNRHIDYLEVVNKAVAEKQQ